MTRSSGNGPRTLPSSPLTRRRLLAIGAVLPIARAGDAAVIRDSMPWSEGRATPPDQARRPEREGGSGYTFFNPAEAAFVEAAVARLIPDDDLGPGALQAGVPFFLDRQLAGEYGRGERWYMQGPWSKGEPTQGWQTRMGPAALYRAAVREIDEATIRDAKSAFAKLTASDQEAWLHRMEDGKLELGSVDAKAFFKLLWQNTLEGYWSDPVYGGNLDMAGWKLIGFPGARYDLSAYVEQHGKPFPLPPVGLRGRPAWHQE